MGVLKPFQLLEINIISAQDLEPMSKKMKTYATVWVHPTRKLTTAVDIEGGNNPTWNDKFVFRVDEEFLRQDTSAVQIEIHCGHWFKDSLVGSVRVLVGNLIPPPLGHTIIIILIILACALLHFRYVVHLGDLKGY
ncbi:hypothetical protein H5410_048727 [Solanum commersonii]|uniref:C2 domain-containing protein n=1 Tax=Solanum commersonii TaxID=4109 RepID=A0A9J5XKF7_SOLCO|nr:hypothetical protein H5410_048727 [Solanum commersonii]